MKGILLAIISFTFPFISFASTTEGLYLKHCSPCHHPKRYGLSGPPLFKETIGNKTDDELREVISKGLSATHMEGFGGVLKGDEIDAIISYIKTPIERPRWDKEDILKSKITATPLTLTLSPEGRGKGDGVDLSNLFMIVEGGTGSVHFMDGDTFTLIDKVKVGAVHGGPKYTQDLHFSYILSRDGWLVKYDLKAFQEVARMKVGINSRNMAVSADGRYLAIANLLPQNLVFMDAEWLEPISIIDTDTKTSAVYTLKERGMFVVGLRDKPEVWLVDYRDRFAIERLPLPQPLMDFFIDPQGRYLVGAGRDGRRLTIFDIQEKEVVKDIEVEAMPHLASAAFWRDGGRGFTAFPHIKSPILTVMELYTWDVVARIALKGPGHFARAHPGNPYIWVDVYGDTVYLIDKKTLRVVKEIVPEKGRFVMHTEFTKDGRFGLVSVRERDGAVYIYDATRLEVIKRIPFDRPVGKYNATNKTR